MKFIEQSSVLTTIGCGPFVPKPPTNPHVVMESVDYMYFMAGSKYLGLNDWVLTCDQAIYEICFALQKKFTEIQECHFEDGRFPYTHEFLGII